MLKVILSIILTCSIASTVHANLLDTNSSVDTKIRIRDSHGKWAFDAPPQRVAVLNWTITEQLIELGVAPIAISDLKGFKSTSPQTLFSKQQNSAVDLGSRFTPNLKKLKSLKPELIIIGYSQRDLLRPLSNIAPVMYFNSFSRRNDNANKADERFLVLAKLFNKVEFAQQKLKQRDIEIDNLKIQLTNTPNFLSPFTVASMKQDDFWAYSTNSIPAAVIKKLGLNSELNDKPTKLGTRKLKTKEINNLNGCLVFINNSTDTTSTLHNNQCTYYANSTNTFGGAMSQLYLAQSIVGGILNN